MTRPEPYAAAPSNDGSRKPTRRRQTKAEAAIMYAGRARWHVFPVWDVVDGRCQCERAGCKDPGKHPHGRLIGNWPKGEGGIKQATSDVEKVRAWWRTDPNANVGIRTGRQSRIIVLDVDSEAAMEALRRRGLPPTLVASTGRPEGGWHVYLAYPVDLGLERIASPNEFLSGVDLRADDSSVVAPPSTHHSGRIREWVAFGPPERGIGSCPEWLRDELRSRAKTGPPATSGGSEPPSGLAIDPSANPPWLLELVASDEDFRTVWLGRREDLASLSEHRLGLADRLARLRSSDQDVLDGLVAFDRSHGRDPEPVATYGAEIAKAREAVGRRTSGRRSQGGSQSRLLLDLLEREALGWGHDQDGKLYARLRGGQGDQIIPLEGSILPDRLAAIVRRETGDVVTPQAIRHVLASFRDECRSGESLVAADGIVMQADAIYIDVARSGDRCLVIRDGRVGEARGPDGVVFRRPGHVVPYEPIDLSGTAGDVLSFLELINAPRDDAGRCLLCTWLVTAFVPHCAHPILVPVGPQGSVKTTLCRYLGLLIDPSRHGPLALTRQERDLDVHLADHYLLIYDNVSDLNPIAGRLCRAVTGETVVRRKLYTDADAVAFSYRRLVAVNGIDIPITQPDLLDRCLMVSLDAIRPEDRKLERDADAAFEAARPRILGGCLNVVAEVLGRPLSVPGNLPRLADWATYGAAVAEVLGFGAEPFLDHYRRNISAGREHAVASNLFITLVADLVAQQARPDWTVQPMRLLSLARDAAGQIGADPRQDRKWPGDPAWVTRRLNQAGVDLRELGITFETGVRGSGGDREIRFRYAAPEEGRAVAEHAAGQ